MSLLILSHRYLLFFYPSLGSFGFLHYRLLIFEKGDAVVVSTKVPQNIANVETPGYKAKQLDFVNVLSEERRNVTAQNIIETQVVEDETASTRSDGNNVNMEKESIELYKAYAQYSMLLGKVRSEFDKYGYVLNSNMK